MANGIFDLFIAGGGVIGLSIGWLASKQGWRVAIADAREIGRGASWAGAGILPPASPHLSDLDPWERFRSLSHHLHRDWSKELREETGRDNGYRACGGLSIARTAGELATLVAQQSLWRELSIPFEMLTPEELLAREPALRSCHPGPLKAWWLPTECQLRNPWHLQALRAACEKRDVVLLEQEPVQQWVVEGGVIHSARTSRRSVVAERYCITAGAWSQTLMHQLSIENGILPVRGQMNLYRFPAQRFTPIINEGSRYLVPREDGHVLAGSCEEEVGFQEDTTPSMVESLHQWAIGLIPALKDAERVRSWAGLRPGSFDGLPYIGKLPDLDNAFVASGHFRNGLFLSPATAEVMMKIMTRQEIEIDLAPFQVARGHSYSR